MTNTSDRFIDEVTEEVRRDRLFGYMRRYGWIAVLLVLLLVGGAAWREWSRAREAAAAQATGDALYAAATAGAAEARAEAFAELSVPGPATAPKLMLEAASLADAGDGARAAETYAALAGDAAQPRIWRDLAALKRILLLGADLAPEERIAALDPLVEPGAPYRVLALEQQALARLELGDIDAAREGLQAVVADQQATPGLRSRAAQLMVTLGGAGDGS